MSRQITHRNGGTLAGASLLAAALTTVTQPVCVLDRDGLIRVANPAAAATLGYPDAGELLGRDGHDTVHAECPEAEAHPASECPLLRPRTTGETVTSELDRFVRRDGSTLPVSYVSAPLELPGGRGAVVAFTDIANAGTRAEVERLAREQAALRHVATLVAAGVEPADLFSAVSREVAQLFGTEFAAVGWFDPDGSAVVVVGLASDRDEVAIGTRLELDDKMALTAVYRTGRAARVDRTDWSGATAPVGDIARRLGAVCTVASPIVVEGQLWGCVTATGRTALPPYTEDRLANFTELVGTAIANAESRARVRRLADEQAALRRVATHVAEAAPPSAVFGAVASEAGALFGADFSGMLRYEDATTVSPVATWAATGDHPEVPERWTIEAGDPMTLLADADAPTRVEDWGSMPGEIARVLRDELGVSCSVGCPIMVEGRAWGAIAVHWKEQAAPAADDEARLGQFADLVATAIANAETRAEVERLADEQAALRRVATLVAEGAAPAAVLDAVAAETERALGAEGAMLLRYEPEDELTMVARRMPHRRGLAPGARVSHKGDNVSSMVRRTGRPARLENYRQARGPIAELARETEWQAAVGAPIVLDGRLWGVIITSWGGERSPPDDTEEHLAKFAQLLEAAIANADSREQLTASRARLLTAADDARRRVVRDLHDGAQTRLVHTIINLKLAAQALPAGDDDAARLVADALTHAELGNEELRELAHGILPASLTNGGLRAGLDALAARAELPVRVDVPPERFAAEIEASAYFVVAEALTNVVKHAHAQHAEVRAFVEDGMLHVHVRDDGSGGADPGGRGLVGIADRVTALGGRLEVQEATGGGTLVAASMPLVDAGRG
jgi:PAS domain S-box-containing protein